MCFSAEADLAAGLFMTVVGVDALRHVRRRSEVPLAILPLVFAGHQLTEVLVWKGLRGDVAPEVWEPALHLYLFVAFAVVPILVPFAIASLEPGRWRVVRWFLALGVAVAAVLVHSLIRGPVEASIEGHHISYVVDLAAGGTVVALYVLATCGVLLVSSHRRVRWFGLANLAAVALLSWIDKNAVISIWCAWAAATTVAIAIHLRIDPVDTTVEEPDPSSLSTP